MSSFVGFVLLASIGAATADICYYEPIGSGDESFVFCDWGCCGDYYTDFPEDRCCDPYYDGMPFIGGLTVGCIVFVIVVVVAICRRRRMMTRVTYASRAPQSSVFTTSTTVNATAQAGYSNPQAGGYGYSNSNPQQPYGYAPQPPPYGAPPGYAPQPGFASNTANNVNVNMSSPVKGY